MDTGKLISLIYEKKCLWDQNDVSYHVRHFQSEAWRDISEQMQESSDNIKKRWRGLRDNYGKEIKRINQTGTVSKWPYFRRMSFIRNYITTRDVPTVETSTVYQPSSSETSDQEEATLETAPPRKKLKTSEARVQRPQSDPDAQFLMSLLPYLKDIPKDRKMIVRSKLQQVFIDEQTEQSEQFKQTEQSVSQSQFAEVKEEIE